MEHIEEDDLQFVIFSTRRKPIPKAESVEQVVVFSDLPAAVTQTAYTYDETTIVVIDFSPLFNILVRTTDPVVPFFKQVDEVSDRAAQVVALSVGIAARNVRKFVFAKVFQQIRIARLARLRSKSGISVAGLKTTRRAGRLQVKVTKKAARLANLAPKARRGAKFIAGARALSKLLRPLIVISLVIETVLIVHRIGVGGQQSGIAGAVGGFAGGLFDAVTLSLAEGVGQKIETATGNFITRSLSRLSGGFFEGFGSTISFG